MAVLPKTTAPLEMSGFQAESEMKKEGWKYATIVSGGQSACWASLRIMLTWSAINWATSHLVRTATLYIHNSIIAYPNVCMLSMSNSIIDC